MCADIRVVVDMMDPKEDFDAVEFEGDLEYDDGDILPEMENIVQDLFVFYEKWIDTRTTSIKEIREMARNMHKCQREIDITNAIGACIGATATLAGAFLTSIGIVLCPFHYKKKARQFLNLGLGAGILGGVGVATSLIVTAVKNTTERQRWKRFLEIIEADSVTTESLKGGINKYNRTLKSLENITAENEPSSLPRNIVLAARGANRVAARISKTVLKAGLGTSKVTSLILPTTRTALQASRILKAIYISLSGISLILDIIYLVQVSIHIHDGSQSEVAKKMEEIADVMEQELTMVKDYMLNMLEEDEDDSYEYESDDGFYDSLFFNDRITLPEIEDVSDVTFRWRDIEEADDVPLNYVDDYDVSFLENDMKKYEQMDSELYRLITPSQLSIDFDFEDCN